MNMSNGMSAMNMSGMNMSGMNMSGMDNSSMDMSGMNMSGKDMSGMDMSGKDMSGMDMSGMDMSGMNMNGSMDMKMYFHVGYEEYVLLKDCFTESVGAMVGACFFIFFVGFLYEGLKFMREQLLRAHIQREASNATFPSGNHVLAGNSTEKIFKGSQSNGYRQMIFSGHHLLQTFLHILQVFISYCLMLVFMTYNVWLCVAVILGAALGYFAFGWKRAAVVDSNEHCH